MLIRSQNKNRFVNLESVTIGICNNHEIAAFRDTNIEYYVPLGKYSTEEKAIKVLDMIQQHYLKVARVEGGYGFQSNSYIQPNVWTLPKLFVMPQDEEVCINDNTEKD